MKVLHILYQSLPQISGSSIRTRDILMTQKEIGINIIAITSPFQAGKYSYETFNDVKYYRSSTTNRNLISDKSKPFYKRILKLFKLYSFYKKSKKITLKEKPDIIHAHAMFFCGLTAIFIGKKLKIPVVYEVRSLWMINKEKKEKTIFTKIIEQLLFKIEIFVLKKVDSVVVINDGLKEIIINAGVSEDKITIIKNAINTTFINSLKTNEPNLSNKDIRFGYIGTLTPHEGVDLLIKSFNDLNIKFTNTKLFIYGNGIEEEKIRTLSKINKNISFLGSVNPDKINLAFNNIDIIVNPRYKNKLTDSVTPLKPLEAMAYEKLVIGSDVGGIKELIENNVTGFLFSAGDCVKLVEVMERAYKLENEGIKKIKKTALKYVEKDKSWLNNAKKYKNLYTKLGSKE